MSDEAQFNPDDIRQDEESPTLRAKVQNNFFYLRLWASSLQGQWKKALDEIRSTIIKPALRGGFNVDDVRYYGTIADAVAAIPATQGKTLYITNEQYVSANLTIPSNISIVVLKGGSFSIATGVTLTINGNLQAGLYQIFTLAGTGVARIGREVTGHLEAAWWGFSSSASAATNHAALQAAVESWTPSGSGGGMVRIRACGEASNYDINDQVVIPNRSIWLQGDGADITQLRYTGTTFQDFIVTNPGQSEYTHIKIKNLGFKGGTWPSGAARYCFYSEGFNTGCELTDCVFRDGVGLLKIDQAYLSTIDRLRFNSTTPQAVTDGVCTQAEWAEVYGTEKAPVMIGGLNGGGFESNNFYRVGSIVQGGVTPYAVMYIEGSPSKIGEVTFENCSTYTSGSTYDLRSQTIVYANNPVLSIENWYNEANYSTNHYLWCKGEGSVSVSNFYGFNEDCEGELFYNNMVGDIEINGGKVYASRIRELKKTLSAFQSTKSRIYIRGLRIAMGALETAAGYTDPYGNTGNNDNIVSTKNSGYPKGMIGEDTGVPHVRLVIPKILEGLTVVAGVDGSGDDYVQVDSGMFMREDGTITNCKRGSGSSGVVATRLFPPTASKYYRVFIGEAGSPFLIEYNSAQTDPRGNWIAEFATDASTNITGLANNIRLTYHGRYMPNQDYVRVWSNGAPSTGRWEVGDVYDHTVPTTQGATGGVCTAAGTPGTWRSIDARDNTVIFSRSVDGNFDALDLVNEEQTSGSTNESVAIRGRLRGGGSSNNRTAGRIFFRKVGNFTNTADMDATIVLSPSVDETPTDTLDVRGGLVDVLAADLTVSTAGKGYKIKEGSNAKSGTATLTAGTVTVSTTAVAAGDRIVLIRQAINASTGLGELVPGTITAGTSFVINSYSPLAALETGDASTVYWQIWTPA